jgi:hypothetical protein
VKKYHELKNTSQGVYIPADSLPISANNIELEFGAEVIIVHEFGRGYYRIGNEYDGVLMASNSNFTVGIQKEQGVWRTLYVINNASIEKCTF